MGISLLNSLLAGKLHQESGSLETASTTKQSCVFLNLQISANNPLNIPAKWVPFVPEGHRRVFSAH